MVGNMKTNMIMKETFSPTKDSGYNPKFQILSDTYSIDYYNESSAIKSSTFEMLKKQTIVVQDEQLVLEALCE